MAWCRQATSDYLSQCCPRSQSPYGITRPQWVNSLSPVKFEWNFRYVILKQILLIDDWIICCEIAQIWMSLDFTDDQSILVQVMAWCHQATSHYLSQCWPRSLSPYGITRPQWVKKNNLCWSICTLSWNTHLCRKFVNESFLAIGLTVSVVLYQPWASTLVTIFCTCILWIKPCKGRSAQISNKLLLNPSRNPFQYEDMILLVLVSEIPLGG